MCWLYTISLTSEWHFVKTFFSRLVQKQTWSRVRLGLGLGLGLGLELVFGKGFIVLVKPLVCYVLSLWGQRNNLFRCVVSISCWIKLKSTTIHVMTLKIKDYNLYNFFSISIIHNWLWWLYLLHGEADFLHPYPLPYYTIHPVRKFPSF
jgi:hypothetical protein